MLAKDIETLRNTAFLTRFKRHENYKVLSLVTFRVGVVTFTK